MEGIHIPTLRSSRPALRALSATDHEALLAMSNDLEVTQHLNEGPPPSAGEVWQRMAFAIPMNSRLLPTPQFLSLNMAV